MKITFKIPGRARPAGSKRAIPFQRGDGRLGVRVTDDCTKGRDWRSDIRLAAQEAYQGPILSGPLRLHVTFWFARPKGHYGTGRNARLVKPAAPIYHVQKPDTTKLLRALEDALTGLIWADDAQVCCQSATKRWADTSWVDVEIEELEVGEPAGAEKVLGKAV